MVKRWPKISGWRKVVSKPNPNHFCNTRSGLERVKKWSCPVICYKRTCPTETLAVLVMVLSWVSQQIWEWWGRAILASVFTQHNLFSAASSLYWLVLKPKNCSSSSHVPFVEASPTGGTSTAVLWLHTQQQCCLNQLVPTLLHSQLPFHFLPLALPTASVSVCAVMCRTRSGIWS